jgi:hypothetical protein
MEKEEFYNLANNQENLNNETLDKLSDLTKEFPGFAAGWMLYLKNLKVTESPDFETVLKSVALRVPDRKRLYQFLFHEKYADERIKDKNKKADKQYDLGELDDGELGDSLIDRFLSSDAGPIRLEENEEKEEESVPENEILESSTSEDDELVTETLAMIYFEQKKYDKALDAFRKLSLKYPEKSVYFATRIEEIEKLKNI